MKTYSTWEASEILKVSERAIQKRCKAELIRKKSNKYLITQEHIDKWKTSIVLKSNERTSNAGSRTSNEGSANMRLILEIEELKSHYNKLLHDYEEVKEDLDFADSTKLGSYTEDVITSEIESVDIDLIEACEFKWKLDGSDESTKGSLVFVPKDKEVEIFDTEQFEQLKNLIYTEHPNLIKEMEHNKELFEAKLKTAEQSDEHYKNAYYYQRGQNERLLEMQAKMLEAIQMTGKENFVRASVEARKTDWSNPKDNK